jgi:DNA repair photolyase
MSDGKPTRISGTKEWAVENVNCVLGCSHRCRYCYARTNALKYGRIGKPEEWGETYNRVRPAEVRRRRPKVDGTVMFPTTHDITPEFMAPCLEVIGRILKPGNRLLIVSKPHLECIEAICREFASARGQILFRFTIGGISESLLAYWEPGAPSFEERLACLRYARKQGFETSVSAEPLLEASRAGELVAALLPYVTDSIWIGKMNQLRFRVVPGTQEAAIREIEAGQTKEQVGAIYDELKQEPQIRWKESYKAVLGLKKPEKAGLDI